MGGNWSFIWAGYAVALGLTAILIVVTVRDWKKAKAQQDDHL